MKRIHLEVKERDIKSMVVLDMVEKIEAAYKASGNTWTDEFEKRLIDTIFEGLKEWQTFTEKKVIKPK